MKLALEKLARECRPLTAKILREEVREKTLSVATVESLQADIAALKSRVRRLEKFLLPGQTPPNPLALFGKEWSAEMTALIAEDATFRNFPLEILRSPLRHAEVVRARDKAVKIFAAAGFSPAQIGMFLNRDRTTISYAIRKEAT